MAVVGRHCFVIQETGRQADVSPFSPEYESLKQVDNVDAAVLYECPYTGKEAILVIQNALHMPAMDNNLIPPFIMREAGLIVNDVPKIQVNNPTEDHHSIVFPEGEFRIPLSLWGVFSYFPSSAPTRAQMEECENVYRLTPDGEWNPNTNVYSMNKENMVDWQGHMTEPQHRKRILLSEVEEDLEMSASSVISSTESKMIDISFETSELTANPHEVHGGVSPLGP
jgi:hypothetical protein